jgi:hypothetical protein
MIPSSYSCKSPQKLSILIDLNPWKFDLQTWIRHFQSLYFTGQLIALGILVVIVQSSIFDGNRGQTTIFIILITQLLIFGLILAELALRLIFQAKNTTNCFVRVISVDRRPSPFGFCLKCSVSRCIPFQSTFEFQFDILSAIHTRTF